MFLIAQNISSDTSLIIRSSKTVFTSSRLHTSVVASLPPTTDVYKPHAANTVFEFLEQLCSTVGRGRADRPDHDQLHCYHHAPTIKPEAATAVVELLIMGVRMPETC